MGFKTWVTEEVLASADVNNLLMKQAVIGCTSGTRPGTPQEGMLIYETDTDTYRGFDGSTWQEIFMLNPPRATVTRTSDQNITTGLQTTITWQASDYNYRNMWSSGVNPSRLTVPSGMGGIYHVQATLEYALYTAGSGSVNDNINSTGTRTTALMKNGAIVGREIVPNAGTGQSTRVTYSREIVAAAGDYFEIAAYQNSTATLAVAPIQTTPFLQARRVGPS
jgi:hypothetical protein